MRKHERRTREQRGLDHKDLLHALNINEKQLGTMLGYFATIDKLEKAVMRL